MFHILDPILGVMFRDAFYILAYIIKRAIKWPNNIELLIMPILYGSSKIFLEFEIFQCTITVIE